MTMRVDVVSETKLTNEQRVTLPQPRDRTSVSTSTRPNADHQGGSLWELLATLTYQLLYPTLVSVATWQMLRLKASI